MPTTKIAGTPIYIPMFSAMTDSPSPRISDSEFAFSINDNELIIGVILNVENNE